MTPAVAEALAPFLGMTALATAVLIGMKMRYNYLTKIRGGGPKAEDLARLADTVAHLRDEVAALHEGVVELGERVDFAERMLARAGAADDAPALPPQRRAE